MTTSTASGTSGTAATTVHHRAGRSTLTIGTAGDANARALYARMASVTGSIANGFPTGTDTATATNAYLQATTAAADTTPQDEIAAFVAQADTSWSAATTTSRDAASTTASDTRISGVGLHLGASAIAVGRRSDGTIGLFTNLRSALDGLNAQTGFDQLIVTRLIGAS